MEEEQKSTTLEKDLEIENMREFLLENQDIKLENLPKYEDIIAPKTEAKLENMQEMNTLPFFETKLKVPFTFRTISVTSSLTPAIVENS